MWTILRNAWRRAYWGTRNWLLAPGTLTYPVDFITYPGGDGSPSYRREPLGPDKPDTPPQAPAPSPKRRRRRRK